MAQSWQFVAVHPDGSRCAPSVRRLIRKNAMRSYHRSQRRQEVKDFQNQLRNDLTGQVEGSPTLEAKLVCSSTVVFGAETAHTRYREHSLHGKDSPTSLQCWSGNWLDPFEQTAMRAPYDAQYLFMHFVNDVAPRLQPFGHSGSGNPVVSLWPEQAIRNPVALESLLFHAAVHHDSLRGRPWTASTWYHRGRCVRQINEQLALSDGNSIDDNVIGAVAFMSAAGNITGDVDQDLIHRRALYTMVECRGGIERLGSNSLLAMLVLIGDMISSAICDSLPATSPPDVASAAETLGMQLPSFLAGSPSSSTSSKGSGPLILDTHSFRTEIFTLIRFVGKLIELHTNFLDALTSSTANMMAFIRVSSAVEHRLLSVRWGQQRKRSSDGNITLAWPHLESDAASVYEAARIATLSCMTYLFRAMGSTSVIVVNLQNRLHAAIKDALEKWVEPVPSSNHLVLGDDNDGDHDGDGRVAMRLLLWDLCTGSLTALSGQRRLWYARRIREGMWRLRIRDLKGLNACLGGYLWTERMAQDFQKAFEEPLEDS